MNDAATTEKHDPWALLREAREELNVLASYAEDPAFKWPSLGLKVRAKAQRKMRDRIDAALAAHDADPPSEVVWIPNGPRGLSGYLKGRVEKASVYQTTDGLWWASASDIGPFDTLDKAQRAALSAARGMR